MTTSTWLRSVVALGVCLLVPKLAAAANIGIDDLTDTITITSANFDGGFTANVTGKSGTFAGTWIANQRATVFFTERSTNQMTDILSVFLFGNPAGRIETMIGLLGPVVPSNLTTELDPVPEPSTLLLLSTGIAGLAAQSRRKRAVRGTHRPRSI